MKRRVKDNVFEGFLILFFTIFIFIIVYPVWNILIYSLNESTDALMGDIFWFPRKFTFDNYIALFKDSSIIIAYGISILRTVLGTSVSILLTAMFAFSLSHSNLKFRKLYTNMGLMTMYFSGGLIPSYLLIKNLGMIDNFLVLVIPYLVFFYYVILFVTFFRGLPISLEESAQIDGANELYIFFRIILPLSTPVVAAIVLFVGVFFWNEYFSAVIYISSKRYLYPIQTYLYKIISEAISSNDMAAKAGVSSYTGSTVSPFTYRIAAMFAVTFPVIIIYPFIQRYLIKGMLVGSIKG